MVYYITHTRRNVISLLNLTPSPCPLYGTEVSQISLLCFLNFSREVRSDAGQAWRFGRHATILGRPADAKKRKTTPARNGTRHVEADANGAENGFAATAETGIYVVSTAAAGTEAASVGTKNQRYFLFVQKIH